VGNKQKRLSRIVSAIQILQAQVHRIVKRSTSFRMCCEKTVLQLRYIRGEVLNQLRGVAELDKKILIFLVAEFQKRARSGARSRKLALHAAADIENDSNTQRNVFL